MCTYFGAPGLQNGLKLKNHVYIYKLYNSLKYQSFYNLKQKVWKDHFKNYWTLRHSVHRGLFCVHFGETFFEVAFIHFEWPVVQGNGKKALKSKAKTKYLIAFFKFWPINWTFWCQKLFIIIIKFYSLILTHYLPRKPIIQPYTNWTILPWADAINEQSNDAIS